MAEDFDNAEFIATTIWSDTRVYQVVRRTPKSIWIVPTVDAERGINHGEYTHIPQRPMTQAEMDRVDLKPQRVGRRANGTFSIYKGRQFYVAHTDDQGRPVRRHDNGF